MEFALEFLGLLISSGLLGYLAKSLGAYFAAKCKNEDWRRIVGRIDEAAMRAVKLSYQAYVGPIKKEGRSLSEEEKKAAMDLAKSELKSYLGMRGVQEALLLFGSDEKQLDKVFEGHIEANVYDEKSFGAMNKK